MRTSFRSEPLENNKMGAKKKGKANKLARMSEEERLRYLQNRAAIEEEARRRKEQLISTFMKNKLKREEIFSRLNMAKINQQWRQTLREIKCVELKQDLEDLFKWFDYTANKKNSTIEMLLEDLDEAESQYSRIRHCHTETMNRLIKIQEQRVEHFHQQYKEERDEIHGKAKADLKNILESYSNDEENLQAALYRMEETCTEKLSSLTSENFSKMDELRNNMLTELENLRTSRELQIERIWLNLETILKKYWEQTEDRRRQYLVLKETDYDNCKQIFENNQQINDIIDVINNLKDQLLQVQAAGRERVLECKTKKEDTCQLLLSLKKKVGEEVENDKRNLNFMNIVTSKTTENLRSILGKGKQILQLQTLCRKLETLNEKICPEGLHKPQLTEEEEKQVQEDFEKYSEPLAEGTYREILQLDGFWKRYNQVLLEKEGLTLHYQSLLNEQKQLKSSLRSYLSDFVVKRPESKVSYANGIKIRRQRPLTCVPMTTPTKTFFPINCIEATESFSPSVHQCSNKKRMNTKSQRGKFSI